MKYELHRPLSIHEIGQRPNQEDSLYPADGQATIDDRLFILCDGMGGHAKGEVASQTVCEVLSREVIARTREGQPFRDEDLQQAMLAMYRELDARAVAAGAERMGTTLVFIYFHAGGVMAAHIGDSRYYHLRPRTGEVRYRSKDHSLVAAQVETGEMSVADAATASGKNVILKAIMPQQDTPTMPDIVHIKDVKPGDWFYLCSDGMLEQMNNRQLMAILGNESMDDEQKRAVLVQQTSANHDNHTAYLIHVAGVTEQEVEAGEPDDEAAFRANNRMLLVEEGELEDLVPAPQPAADAAPQPLYGTPVEDAVMVAEESTPIDRTADMMQQAYNGPSQTARIVDQPKQGSSRAGLIIGILLALAVVGAGLWFFFLKGDNAEKEQTAPDIKEAPIDATPMPAVPDDDYVAPHRHAQDDEATASDAGAASEKPSATPSRTNPSTRTTTTTTQKGGSTASSGKKIDPRDAIENGKGGDSKTQQRGMNTGAAINGIKGAKQSQQQQNQSPAQGGGSKKKKTENQTEEVHVDTQGA